MTDREKKFSYLFYNAVTYVGVMISLVVLTAEIFLFALDFIDKGRNVYLGLFTYVLLPAVLIFGLLLIPAGVMWKKSRIRRGLPEVELRRFRLDLSLSQHRNALLVFVVGTTALMLMTVVGSYKAFHYTESVEFCGITCHQQMKPEHTAHMNSPHARVKCVDCHVGEGADSYVGYKLAGVRQLIRAVTHTYRTPIETPVKNLRPAAETCEKCHWPEKFYSTRDLRRTYFLTEGDDREWQIRMLLNVGGDPHGTPGVHAHMNVEHDVYYAAEDDARQKISWVKSIAKNGSETIFVTEESKYRQSPPPPDKIRKMDCIDCHNRPTHRYGAPYRLVDEGMRKGRIDASLPEIKEKAVEVLAEEYKTEDEALATLSSSLEEYYRTKYPDIFAEKKETIDRSVGYLKEIFSKNMFPEMKARWDAFPDNIGHLVSPGCFRCHDGEHRAMGKGLSERVITRDCNACHRIIEQGPAGKLEKNLDGMEFRHPVDDDNGWRETRCSDCHTGAAP